MALAHQSDGVYTPTSSRAEAKFGGIVAIAADAIVTADKAQRITLFNTGAERIFG